jgi:hypothetical protein
VEFLAGISVWLVGLGAMLSLSAWILGPLEKKAKLGKRRLQFTLVDWICLIGMIQVWAAATHTSAMFVDGNATGILMMDAYGWFLIAVLWVGAVWRLSCAGVRKAWHRLAALVFIYPLNVLGALIAPSLLWIGVANAFAPSTSRLPAAAHVACILALILILVAILASARFVRKMVAGIATDDSTPSTEDSQGHEGHDPESGQNNREQK